jgi:hypothetical protein
MYTYTMNENEGNEMKYCASCGYVLSNEDSLSLCLTCGALSAMDDDALATYVPAVCGDDVCYLDYQGMPNFDGDCSHEEDFRSLVPGF